MALNTTSLSNTPQAKDDIYGWNEDQLKASGLLAGNVITLNVMSNDLGGSAKTLYSIEGDADTLSALLDSDTNGLWETTDAGNLIRIYAGKIQLDITASLPLGATIDSLGAGETIHDEFVSRYDWAMAR